MNKLTLIQLLNVTNIPFLSYTDKVVFVVENELHGGINTFHHMKMRRLMSVELLLRTLALKYKNIICTDLSIVFEVGNVCTWSCLSGVYLERHDIQ